MSERDPRDAERFSPENLSETPSPDPADGPRVSGRVTWAGSNPAGEAAAQADQSAPGYPTPTTAPQIEPGDTQPLPHADEHLGAPTAAASPLAEPAAPATANPAAAAPLPRGRRPRRGPGWSGTIAVGIITALATLGASYLLWGPATGASLSRSGAEVATQPPVRQASAQETNWEAVAKSVQKSVVAILVRSNNSGDTGSGVIFDTKGHILTNYHVVASAITGNAQISLQLSDGSLYKGKVVGSDATTDLAVLAFDNPPKDLQMVALGSSSNLRVGQQVAAIGAPLGLENTMTTGIISALDRPVTVTQSSGSQGNSGPLGIPGLQAEPQGEQVVTNAIQVDAAINPGNSGGPLFAADGSVIGITSSIASLSQSGSDASGSIGIGFAIPVNLAKSVADQILSTGSAQHAYLGVMIRTGSTSVDGRTVAGAEVADVVSGGAAAAAGLKKGDVIVAIDKHTVTSGTALTGYVRWYVPGDKVSLTYVRGDTKETTEATLGTTNNEKTR